MSSKRQRRSAYQQRGRRNQRTAASSYRERANTFLAYYERRELPSALSVAEDIVDRYPGALFGWKALGTTLMEGGDPDKAIEPLKKALDIQPEDHEAHSNLAKTYQKLGQYDNALHHLREALRIRPDDYQANIRIADIYKAKDQHEASIEHLDIAMEAEPDSALSKLRKANTLIGKRQYDEGLRLLESLVYEHPNHAGGRSNLANLYGTMGRFSEAEDEYQKAMKLAPGYHLPFSNYFFTAHYNPAHDAESFYRMAASWHEHYSRNDDLTRAATTKSVSKRLKIGLVSSGLRSHPVGQMITSCLENVDKRDFELIAYADRLANDYLGKKIKAVVDEWHDVPHLQDEALADKIVDDSIDILIDMTGHTSGNRLMAVAREPAPLIVKWVGGLFNTVGLESFDYLVSDFVETPDGSDEYYFEKLIRLPDDYICYLPPYYAPEVSALPVLTNGFLTFGCFNNPAKINEPLLSEWARLMKEVPESRLYMIGGQYTNESYCEWIYQYLESHGIGRERILLEGPKKHKELLESYNQVDISLDPWPYSGGLTTCEALLMGVPVVTMPGPTFAGRHSATHLVNAGMPELVTNSWDEYRERVLELAGDLDSLSTIRQHLREVLTKSPVCDGPRFAKHFTTAMRAIWQRYCDDKAPAALTFNKEGQAWFEDEDTPVHIEPTRDDAADTESSGFRFQFEGKIIAIDNGGELLNHAATQQMLSLNAFEVITFDPRSEALQHSLIQHERVHHYPNTSLGDGQPATLYTCLDPSMTASLPPLPSENLSDEQAQGAKVLAKLPLNTIALDSIEGLPSLDWLVLDDRCDTGTILENGKAALKDTLLIQVRVAFQPTHASQVTLDRVTEWARQNGFRFYRLHNLQHKSHLPARDDLIRYQSTELTHADVLLLPNRQRVAMLDDNRRMKLAFILHTVYQVKDLTHELILNSDETLAEHYLVDEGLLGGQAVTSPSSSQRGKKRKVFVVGFPKSGTSTLQKALEESGYRSAHWKVKEGYVGELMYLGLESHDDPWYYLSHYDAITQGDVCIPSQGLNFWPQLDISVIEKIRQHHPDCLFILNYRDPDKTVASIMRWGDLGARIESSDIPGLPVGNGDQDELKRWIENHFKSVRALFEGSGNFLEIDIESDNARRDLGKFIGISIGWWGVENKNDNLPKNEIIVPKRPHMSEAEGDLFHWMLRDSRTYFEFGSGGSTVWAAEQGLTVYGVESDSTWVNGLSRKLGDACQISVVDIGPTKEWGYPVSLYKKDKFPGYSLAIHEYKEAFDLILVDGRFRVACILSSIRHILENHDDPSKARIFVHDFWNRNSYHVALEFLEIVDRVQTAAVFKVAEDVDIEQVQALWEEYSMVPS
ncbi:tetratricopeptide repeat protein [Aidingimonas halophila]|uniref:protein O-GlcNAc transferase n=1 Tax=Aidingimonas halophila TaxID=574349 RepID=A0A1H3D6I3_9GAMM|nr:tetratricopeptide repeat protein [Aidingimonas halophila]GHC30442.1 hypothetical protein GCM10008094_23440 [Aidingimonas halophila]SDX62122.1 Predicted O-linked N-acetylglucosamine transferase, SPINDLY family [Aidingimonas halophila]